MIAVGSTAVPGLAAAIFAVRAATLIALAARRIATLATRGSCAPGFAGPAG